MSKTINWGTEAERREDARRLVRERLAAGDRPEKIDAGAQLCLIEAAAHGPEHVKAMEFVLDALDELVTA